MQHVDGLQFAYIKQNGMFFVVMTRQNISPALGIEVALRASQLIKDYCGVLTEEAIRKNLGLIYELLDEYMVRFTRIIESTAQYQ
jgi:AP-4 complex subunit mu-1